MKELMINPTIFPLVLSMYFVKKCDVAEVKQPIKIDIPRGVYLIYLSQIHEHIEIDLLKKYAEHIPLSDAEYEAIIRLFLNDSSRNHPSKSSGFSLEDFGITLNSDLNKFDLLQDHIQRISAETWEYIVLDLLHVAYSEIIGCFDFGGIDINLGPWKTQENEIKQSLLNALRSAFIFTLVGFIWGDHRAQYSSFSEYFDGEFYKRVVLVNGYWKSKQPQEKVEYIPIFDSFFNLDHTTSQKLLADLRAILENNDIAQDDRQMIINHLVDGASAFHQISGLQREYIESSTIKPVVNFLVELNDSQNEIKAATFLASKSLFNQSIHNSYYAMMHALKAFLEKQNKLTDWDPVQLNVKENHAQLEMKLQNEVALGNIGSRYLANFRIVKQRRWIADYNICYFNKADAEDSIRLAQDFLDEVQRLTR